VEFPKSPNGVQVAIVAKIEVHVTEIASNVLLPSSKDEVSMRHMKTIYLMI
jgi:hypothetical protein